MLWACQTQKSMSASQRLFVVDMLQLRLTPAGLPCPCQLLVPVAMNFLCSAGIRLQLALFKGDKLAAKPHLFAPLDNLSLFLDELVQPTLHFRAFLPPKVRRAKSRSS